MDDVLRALEEQQAELTRLVADLPASGWAHPSRCDGWDIADVVLHLAQTNEMALGSVEGRFAAVVAALTEGIGPALDVDEGAAAMVARDRGTPVLDRWRDGAASLVSAFRAADPHARVEWVAGQLSVHTLVTTRLAETWIHTGDVASGLGVRLAPTARLAHIARLAWRTLPYAFARAGRSLAGPVAFSLRGPDGEAWSFGDEPAVTTVRGDAEELCLVAARRLDPAATSLEATGPDAAAVLDLVRTYA